MRLIFFALLFNLAYGKPNVHVVSSFDARELFDHFSLLKNRYKCFFKIPEFYKTSKKKYNPKKIIVLDPLFGGGPEIFPLVRKEKLICFNFEPQPIPNEIYECYSRVYTWDDSLVDNHKFFKFFYPSLKPSIDDGRITKRKNLSCIISGNWTQDRQQIVEFFQKEAPDELDIYGWWLPPNLRVNKMHKGMIRGPHDGIEKILTLQKYKFCICFENTPGLKGYITEKIFGCFAAGCIPIYYGAENITDYIPSECFIDFRNFKNVSELYDSLKNMSDERLEKYATDIRAYLSSPKADLFTLKYFEKMLQEAIDA